MLDTSVLSSVFEACPSRSPCSEGQEGLVCTFELIWWQLDCRLDSWRYDRERMPEGREIQSVCIFRSVILHRSVRSREKEKNNSLCQMRQRLLMCAQYCSHVTRSCGQYWNAVFMQ